MSIFEAKENSSISKNIGFAFLAQGVGFASSLLIALILPRFLGLEDYAFWQMFLLYSSYSGLALLGVNDGIYLRLGGKEYSTLDYRSLKTQLIIAYIFQLFIASIFCAFVAGGQFSDHYKTVLIMVAASGLIANLMSCLRYIFLSSNLTQIASMAEFFSKSFFLLSSLAALLFGFVDYRKYVLLYILSQLVALVYLMICAKKNHFGIVHKSV